MSNIFEVQDLVKTYELGKIRAVDHINLAIKQGEYVSIQGPSGCGKSTLLQLLGALDKPDQGKILFRGTALENLDDMDTFRAKQIGFIFQLHNLLPSLTALENVEVPMMGGDTPWRERPKKAFNLLEKVGISHRAHAHPHELSGGERQRVSIARALANKPTVLLADEPTGNLDSNSGQVVLDLLDQLQAQEDLTVIIVTHNNEVSARAGRLILMRDGKIISDKKQPKPLVHTPSIIP